MPVRLQRVRQQRDALSSNCRLAHPTNAVEHQISQGRHAIGVQIGVGQSHNIALSVPVIVHSNTAVGPQPTD